MPHYWFIIPLETAPHLAEAKARGGAPAVKEAIHEDVVGRDASLVDVLFPPDLSWCRAHVFSPTALDREIIRWFHERWDIQDDDPDAHEALLGAEEVGGTTPGGDATAA